MLAVVVDLEHCNLAQVVLEVVVLVDIHQVPVEPLIQVEVVVVVDQVVLVVLAVLAL